MRGLASSRSALRYAEQVIEVLEPRAEGSRVATLDDVRNDVVVSAICADPAVVDAALVLPQVRALLEHDAAQGTEYARTLLTYLGTFGDVAMTAQRLNIHDNTARYRVRRLAEMFGIDLAAGDETLVVWRSCARSRPAGLSRAPTAGAARGACPGDKPTRRGREVATGPARRLPRVVRMLDLPAFAWLGTEGPARLVGAHPG